MSRLLRRLFPRAVRPPHRIPVIRRATNFRARLLLEVLEGRVAPAVFTVTNANDSGAGSLRDAVTQANADTAADTIIFNSFFATPQAISLQSALPTITRSVTIAGPGAGLLTVRRDSAAATNFGIFAIIGSGFTVSLSGMTITGGRTSAGSGFGGGVLVVNDGADLSLTIQDAVITGNSASRGGGGIVNGFSSLTVRNSTISGNISGTDPTSTIRGGGGIRQLAGSLFVDSSTISGNTSPTDGGAIHLYTEGSSSISCTVRNSTISGNTAGARGGGIFLLAPQPGTGFLNLLNSTVANNAANGTGPGQGGGGIAAVGSVITATILSSIIANNPVAQAPDLVAPDPVIAHFSLIRNQTGNTFTSFSSNNLPAGTDPRLGSLANNGGPTQTMAVLAGSPAINTGSNQYGATTDQRGAGFPRVVGSAADIGAYERPGTVPSASGSFGNVTAAGGTSYTFTVTYADPAGINVGTLDSSDIRVTGPNGSSTPATFVSVDNSSNGTPRTATYRITAPGGTFDAADDGTYAVSVEPFQVFSATGVDMPARTLGAFQVLIPLTLTVTNANDAGAGSLRDAVIQAEATASADTIVFSSSFSSPRTISLQTALPTIGNPVTITGPGSGLLTVRRDPAAASFRIFTLAASGGNTATLSGMTVTGGRADAGGGVSVGVVQTLTIQDVVITGNSSDGPGGGVFAPRSTLTVRNSTISGNTAGTNAAAASRSGGGIYMYAGGLLVENSTISGNTTPTAGGGLYLVSGIYDIPTYTVRNSTISGNTAGTSGGGIMLVDSGGVTLAVTSCTIANNTANGAASGQGGGGIAKIGSGGTASLASTIVANNTNALAPDVLGPVAANFSLIRNQTGATVSGANNLPAGTNPLLGALANNGGPTQTMALLLGSPAINAGSNASGVTTDQRGPGYPRLVGAAADIGAVEAQQVQSVVVNAGQVNLTQRSQVTSVTITFSGRVTFAGPAANAFQLARAGPSTPTENVTLAVDVSGSTATQTVATLTFSGPLIEGSTTTPSLIDGNYTLTVFGGQVNGGILGGDNVSTLFRFFGDVNGDKAVNGLDLAVFRTAFGTIVGDLNYVSFLDQNGDGAINGLDLAQFRIRFGTILP